VRHSTLEEHQSYRTVCNILRKVTVVINVWKVSSLLVVYRHCSWIISHLLHPNRSVLGHNITIFLRLAFSIQYKQFDMKDVPPMSNVSHINILVYHISRRNMVYKYVNMWDIRHWRNINHIELYVIYWER
jgi:hypothetical protein